MATIDLRGLPEVNKMLGQFEGAPLRNRTRRALRGAGAVYRKRMRSGGNRGWAKRPKSFYQTRTRNHQNPLSVSVAPKSPLSTIFEGGASDHRIGASGQVLSNFGSRRQGGADFSGGFFSARGPVSHPGVAARPFVGPIFTEGENEAKDAFTKELFEGIK